MAEKLVKYQINGIDIQPVNADRIGFKFDWTGDAQEAELTSSTVILSGQAKKLVNDHIDQFGPFNSLDFTATIGTVSIEYFIDCVEGPKISGEGDSSIEVSIFRKEATSSFKKEADVLSFEAINKTHPISLIECPYLIIKDNQGEILLVLSISVYSLTKAFIEGIRDIVTLVTAPTIQAATPNVGVPPSVDLGDVIALVLKLAAQIIYLVAVLLALIDLTKQIIEIIFPPVRKLKAAKVLELLEKGCEKLGYEFSSNLLNAIPQLTILPVPLKENNNSIFTSLFTLNNGSYTKGYPTSRDSTSKLGQVIDGLGKMLNSKIRVVGNTVHLEQRDYWELLASVNIQNTLNLQDIRENQWEYNSEEFWKRYWMYYQIDGLDTNTLDNIDFSQCEYSTEAINVQAGQKLNITGEVRQIIPWSLGIIKRELTTVEKAAIPFGKVADSVVQFFGGSSNIVANINGRIGNLQLSNQHYGNTKILYTVNGKQPLNYLDKIGANVLYKKHHTINQVRENFKRLFDEQIPFSVSNFESINENNYLIDDEGNAVEVLTFEYIAETSAADIRYARKSDEGSNTQTILING